MKAITRYAREHRRNPTKAEAAFKKFLIGKIKFRTQRMYSFYIVDFLFPDKWAIVELDGSSHEGKELYDRKRDDFLANLGFDVLHYSNELSLKSPNTILRDILSLPDKPEPENILDLYGKSAY